MKIPIKSTENVVYFPKNLSKNTETSDILLFSELSNKKYEFLKRTDEKNLYDYYVFTLDLSEVEDGEYVYYVKNDGNIVSKGVLNIGDINTNTTNTTYVGNDSKFIIYKDE